MAKYSQEIRNEICGNIKDGLNNKDAALLAGVSETTLYRWINEKEEFRESIKKVEVERKAHFIRQIKRASKRTWQAAAWYLERRYPGEFGKDMKFRSQDKTKVTLSKEELDKADEMFGMVHKAINQNLPTPI